MTDDSEKSWSSINNVVTATAENIIDYTKKKTKKQEWMTNEILVLMKDRRQMKI